MDLSKWTDVTPVPQDDGPNPLVTIAYTKEYNDCMSYFRAILQANETSERVLQLTAEILDWNPGHYSVWAYRLKTVLALVAATPNPGKKQAYLASELDFVDSVAISTPKSYQLWHYRQGIVEQIGSLGNEMNFVNNMLDSDSKNYHAWAYRQWLVTTFNLWEAELEETVSFIQKDVRNNSAWNQRFFVLTKRPEPELTDEICKSEVEFVDRIIALAPHNESPWIYLKGILELADSKGPVPLLIQEICLKYTNVEPPITFALSLLAELYKEQKSDADYIQICEKLEALDPIRKKYWAFKKTLVGR